MQQVPVVPPSHLLKTARTLPCQALSDGLSPSAGVRMGSLGLFLQCAISLVFSLVMDRLVQRFGTRAVYLASVAAFPVAAGATCLSHSVAVVTASAALTGFTFSALQILPYTLASLYHRERQVLIGWWVESGWEGWSGFLGGPLAQNLIPGKELGRRLL